MILLVEDNEAIRETIVAYLSLAGHAVKEYSHTQAALDSLPFLAPRLAILDVMLPDGSGFALAKELRRRLPGLPFLFLSARGSESDRITGLELGAEDYIVKPFSPRELVLRVQAILRRRGEALADEGPGSPVRTWRLGDRRLSLDHASHECRVDRELVALTAAEWNILDLLARRSLTVVSREQILGEGLDYRHDGSDRTVNTHIKNLRLKLGSPAWIETVRGFGYKFTGRP